MKTLTRIICLAVVAIMLSNWMLWNKSHIIQTGAYDEIVRNSFVAPSSSLSSTRNSTSDGDHPVLPIELSNESGSSDFFSSCLLVMDENHRLPEWLAYHYYMLPLRHVVIMNDPAATTNPNDILEKWRPYIEITFWSDETINFQPSDEEGHPKASIKDLGKSDAKTAVRIHRQRQRFFYKKCAEYLRSRNRTWVTFHDVDEYLQIDTDVVPNAHERIKRHGSILELIQDHAQTKGLPVTQQIKSLSQAHQNSCIMAPRTYFGATESDQESVQKLVPRYLNGARFETLRWLQRTEHSDFGNNGRGKSIIHVSRPDILDFKDKGVHSMIKTCQAPDIKNAPLRIRHYLGSWEIYTSRLDPRRGGFRNLQHYLYRAELGKNRPKDDFIRPWLEGFCHQFQNNETLIRYLLEGTGQVMVDPIIQQLSSNVSAWSLAPVRIKEQIESKAAQKPGTFPNWLKNHYRVKSLSNGTLVIKEINQQ